MCRQRRLPSHWFTVLVTLVGIAVVIFCEVRISHIAMHEAAPLPVRTAPSARERPARLGLIARRLVLRADAKYTPRAHATYTPARQQHCGKSDADAGWPTSAPGGRAAPRRRGQTGT